MTNFMATARKNHWARKKEKKFYIFLNGKIKIIRCFLLIKISAWHHITKRGWQIFSATLLKIQ
jgi:hypothetical protein